MFYVDASKDMSEIVYRIKATNVGNYVVPPAYGEAMYDRSVVGARRPASWRCRGRENGESLRRCLPSLVVATATVIGVRFAPRAPLAARIPSSTAVFDEQGRLLRLTLASDQQYRLWTPLDEVPQEFVDALLLHEDRHFYRHAGFNPAALARAALSSYSGGPRIGGSTITMQLARLLYGLNTRSVGGKLQQIARAVQLELCYSKREMLEAHLNLMPYGGNIQGVGAASLIYFGKPAARLDLAEALALVLIPQSPARRAPVGPRRRGAAQRPPAIVRALDRRASASGRFGAARRDAAAVRLAARSAVRRAALRELCVAASAQGHAIRTTLDSRLQIAHRARARQLRPRAQQHRHSQRRRAARRLSRHVGARDGRLRGFQFGGDRRPGERHAGEALARLGAQAVHLRARDRSGPDPSADGAQGRADLLRPLQPRELRRPLRRPDHRDRSARALPQRARRRAVGAAHAAESLRVPARSPASRSSRASATTASRSRSAAAK